MRILFILFAVCWLLSCEKLVSINDLTSIEQEPIAEEPKLDLSSSNSPFLLDLSSAKFYQDIAYATDSLNVFDFFMPNKSMPSSLCIIIHGGGFVGGDKTQPYEGTFFKDLINNLLKNNIAVASINYRLVETNETEGIIKCLNDSKRALQFMRYYANSLKFEKQKVLLMGTSAGAATGLWIGLNDEMANVNATDSILNESTRVRGIVSIYAQSSYDVLEWHNSIFFEYQTSGFDFESVKSILTEDRILNFFGVSNLSELASNEMITYRNRVNMLGLLSNDDPELYITTSGVPYTLPTEAENLYHHPLHVQSLKDKAAETNTIGIFYCPEIELDTRNGEEIEDFILRKIGT